MNPDSIIELDKTVRENVHGENQKTLYDKESVRWKVFHDIWDRQRRERQG